MTRATFANLRCDLGEGWVPRGLQNERTFVRLGNSVQRELRSFGSRANNFREIEDNKSILRLDPNHDPNHETPIRPPQARPQSDPPQSDPNHDRLGACARTARRGVGRRHGFIGRHPRRSDYPGLCLQSRPRDFPSRDERVCAYSGRAVAVKLMRSRKFCRVKTGWKATRRIFEQKN